MAFNIKNATIFMNNNFLNATSYLDSTIANRTASNSSADQLICQLAQSQSVASVTFFVVFAVLMICKLAHIPLHFVRQPRLVTEIIVGIVIGNLDFADRIEEQVIPSLMMSVSEFGMSCYLLVLGLEMDLSVLVKWPTSEALLAYATFISTFLTTAALVPYLKFTKKSALNSQDMIGFHISLAVTLSGTASTVLTRLVTDLKMKRSHIGQLVVPAGMYSDMLTMLFSAISSIFYDEHKKRPNMTTWDKITVAITFSVQSVIVVKFVPTFVHWINTSNPRGKPMKGAHLVMFLGFMFILCNLGPGIIGYSPVMTSFLVGLAFPRKGRLSKMLINKINQFLSYILFPLYFCWIGASARLSDLAIDDDYIGVKLFFLFVIMTTGKVAGSLLASMTLGCHWREGIAMGLLLNIKGHFYIFSAIFAKKEGIIGQGSYIVMLLLTILTIMYLPFVIKKLVSRAKTQSTLRLMGLQWLDTATELRMLLCIHGPQNIQAMINIMEISRGNRNSGLGVYVTDMIEINDTTFLPEDNSDGISMADESVVNMREEISNSISRYLEDRGKGIDVHRLLAISTFGNMHNDVCNLAEAVQASIIVLPYHKIQKVLANNKIDDSIHHGFRHVNRKVLRHAPCSVGILVDRGFGLVNQGSASSKTIKVAVVFIGGKDDREALFYAVHVAKHPRISLTAIRFLQDASTDKPSSRASQSSVLKAMQEQEMKLDDECFTQFYENIVAHGKVLYVEKHVSNAKETVSTLRSLEDQYVLFIVGRGSRVNSISTAIMNDWEECPDLGPIGEIIGDKDFSSTASVLVIQQHCIDELEDEFKIM